MPRRPPPGTLADAFAPGLRALRVSELDISRTVKSGSRSTASRRRNRHPSGMLPAARAGCPAVAPRPKRRCKRAPHEHDPATIIFGTPRIEQCTVSPSPCDLPAPPPSRNYYGTVLCDSPRPTRPRQAAGNGDRFRPSHPSSNPCPVHPDPTRNRSVKR